MFQALDKLTAEKEIKIRGFEIHIKLLSEKSETEFLQNLLKGAKKRKKKRYEEKQKRSYSGSGTVLQMSGFTSNTKTYDIVKKLHTFDHMNSAVKVKYIPGDRDAYLQFTNSDACYQVRKSSYYVIIKST